MLCEGLDNAYVQIPFTGSIAVSNTLFANFKSQECDYSYGATGWTPPYFDQWNYRILDVVPLSWT